jgi:hypothetical protein
MTVPPWNTVWLDLRGRRTAPAAWWPVWGCLSTRSPTHGFLCRLLLQRDDSKHTNDTAWYLYNITRAIESKDEPAYAISSGPFSQNKEFIGLMLRMLLEVLVFFWSKASFLPCVISPSEGRIECPVTK